MRTLICDSRQQRGKHDAKHAYFEQMGVHVVRSKLYVGDYQFVGGTVSCDTKRNLQELWSNLRTKQHDRFVRECDNAREAGMQLVVLTENVHSIRSLADLAQWVEPLHEWKRRCSNKRKPVRIDGKVLAKTCSTVSERHGVLFAFCSPEVAGEKVLEILDRMEKLKRGGAHGRDG